MTGVTSPESDCSEFVEVDPTGRYGRVDTLIFFNRLSCFLCFVLQFLFFNLAVHVLTSKFVVFGSTTKFSAKELQRQCMDSLLY